MASRGSIGDNAGTAGSAQPRAFNNSDSTEIIHALDTWREKQVQNLQALREQVNKVTHGNTAETAAVGAFALGIMAGDVLTHGKLHRAAEELAPAAAKSLGLLSKTETVARTGTAIDRIAARDASSLAEQVFHHKPKSVSMGDLTGWQEAELQNKIRGDKVVRGLTADFREAKGAHNQVNQDLAIATRDQTQLSTELNGLKQLRSETVDSPLTAESSPALRKLKTAQQHSMQTAIDGTQEEKDSARRGMQLARENFEKAQAAAPARIDQIEGVAGKPGLLSRVNEHVAALQTKAAAHVDTIAELATKATARMEALRESKDFQLPTSAEDQAFRKREQVAGVSKPAQSILTAEERTGIAAPPPKAPVETAKIIAPEKPAPAKAAADVFPVRTNATPTRVESTGNGAHSDQAGQTRQEFRNPQRDIPGTISVPPVREAAVIKDAPPIVPAVKDIATPVTAVAREASGVASIDSTYANALEKTNSFRNADGKSSLRGCLQALKEYKDSVSATLKTETDFDKRSKIVTDAVRDLEQLLQPLSPGGKVASAEAFKSFSADKRFLSLSSTIDARLSGIERGIAERAAKAGGAERVEKPIHTAPVDAQISPKTRAAIDMFTKVADEIPKDARIYAVRTDGKIVDVTLPSNREPGSTRTVPKRVEANQIKDLGAESVLARNFGKNNDIGYFVVVEAKRDANGAVVITNAADVAAKNVTPIPDQVVSRVIGSVPGNGFKPGSSFRDFVGKFNQQIAVAQKK